MGYVLLTLALGGCGAEDGSKEDVARSAERVNLAGVTFQAVLGGQYYSAQNDGGGAVNATATSAQAWEKFTLIDGNGGALMSGDSVFIQVGNGQFFQAANGGGSTLNAGSNNQLTWETFKIVRASGSGAIHNGDIVGLQTYNRDWVSAQNGGGGPVYAYGAALGPWEQIRIGGLPSSTTPPGTLVTVNFKTQLKGNFVGAQNDGGGAVIATATVAGAWETFTLIDSNGGSLESGDSVFIRAGNGQYFQAANGGGSTLNAGSNNTLSWETFRIVKASGSGAIKNGDIVGLQTVNGPWVSAQNGGGGLVYAYGGALGPWELFITSGLPSRDAGPDGGAREVEPDGGGAETGPAIDTVFAIDRPNVVRRSNIVLGKPNADPTQFVPVGNGTLGAAIWAANGLTAQLNRWDTFPNRKSPGQLIIPGLSRVTGAADFKGYLDLYDAKLVESGGGMTATIYVRADAQELVVDVTGADPNSMQSAEVQLWSGRSPTAQVSGSIGTLAETWQDPSGQWSSNQTYGTLAGLTAGGRNVVASVSDPMTVRVDFQPNADGSFRVIVAAPTWTGGNASATASASIGSDATQSGTNLTAAHLAWWHDYWSRVGVIKLTSADGTADYFEAMRHIYLYTTASESRGGYPGSHAGVADLFNFSQDRQQWWAAGYWYWNLRMQIAANMTSGVFDMNAPIFNLYQSNLSNMQAWTQAHMGGRPGICLPETMRFNGNSNGGGSCQQENAPNFNALTITSGAELALWIWQQYLMTGDQAFLNTNYPLMSESAQFLLAYATTGSDGLLHTVADAHETQWKVNDPVTDIVWMRALFPVVISAAQVLGKADPVVAQLKDAIGKIPPLPRTDASTHTQALTVQDDASGQDVFAISAQPSAQKHNGENIDLEVVWPSGLIGDKSTMGLPGDNGANTDLAKRTYTNRMFHYSPDWCFDVFYAARLGLSSEVKSNLINVTKNYQVYVNGMSSLGGVGYQPYIELDADVCAAVNEALVQDYDGLLRINPAFPSDWGAEGSVFVQGGSKVDLQVQGGNVTALFIEAGSSSAIQMRNPWPGQMTTAIDGSTGATVVPATSADVISVPVTKGHWYAVIPGTGASLPQPVMVTGTPATSAKSPPTLQGRASIGL